MNTGPWRRALVTGASSGIGEAFARSLATRCDALTLVARRAGRLQALAGELATDCEVSTLSVDLLAPEETAAVVEHIRQHGPVDLLVNNAGFSTLGPFAESHIDSELAMVRLHEEVPMTLARAVLPGMREEGRGDIINVASIAAYLTLPGVATYAGTKAFLANFSRALHAELAGTGVRVQCLCPGYTRTEIHSRESFAGFDASRVPDALWMEPEAVVEESLAALADNRALVVPGAENRRLIRDALGGLAAALADQAP